MQNHLFEFVEPVKQDITPLQMTKPTRQYPYSSMILLGIILCGCVFIPLIVNHNPTQLNLQAVAQPPNGDFYFGTDTLGRDVFSMIWYGGRVSILIGLLAAGISGTIALLYGTMSAFAVKWIDDFLMRAIELALSIPSILLIIFLQAIVNQANPIAIAVVIGCCSWMGMAKMVRDEVQKIKHAGYMVAAKTMHANFFHVLKYHILPNIFPSMMFMLVTSVSSAITTEATLSFLGIGLPVESISWGSILAQADKALLSNQWWLIVIPGIFLVITIICITQIANHIRRERNQTCSKLW